MYNQKTIEQNIQHQLNVHANNIAQSVQDSGLTSIQKDSLIANQRREINYMDSVSDSLFTEIGKKDMYILNHNSDIYFGIGLGAIGAAIIVFGAMLYNRRAGVQEKNIEKRATGTRPIDGSKK